MKIYAVRQKSTGLFIPRLETGKRRGGSWLEPSNEREPRTFHNQIAARAFLGNWLQGIFKNENHTDHETGTVESYPTPEKQPHRNKEDMEVVEFNCLETKCNANLNTIIRYDFNIRNQPNLSIGIFVDDGVTKVFAPGVADTIFVPNQTGVDITIDFGRMLLTSDVVGQVEIIRTGV